MRQTIENRIASVEQLFNRIDWVPCIGSFFGMVRILAGAVEVAAGAAFAALKCFYIVLTGNGWYETAIEDGLTYSIHGIGNIIRGCIAMVPVANMILLQLYDNKMGRMNYELETLRKGVYPIMTAHRIAENYAWH